MNIHFETGDRQCCSTCSSVCKSEIHSTMIDKCLQSCKTKTIELEENGLPRNEGFTHLATESGKPSQSFVCISVPKELVSSPHVALEDPTTINCLSQVGQCLSTSLYSTSTHTLGQCLLWKELGACGLPPQKYRKILKNLNNSNL